MRITPRTELDNRYRALQQQMAAEGLEAVIAVQNADLFYFAGSIQQGVLYIPVCGEPVYMVRRDYGRARMESGLKEVVPIKSPRDIPGILADYNYAMPKKAGMELDVLPVAFFQRFQKVFEGCEICDATPLIRTVRAIKSAYEIEIMRDAATQLNHIYERAKEFAKPGVTDYELFAELAYAALQKGHQGMSRMRGFNNELFIGHVLSGPDSAAPAYCDTPLGGVGVNPFVGQGASYNSIKENQPIIIDFLGAFDGYLVDQTRVLVIGELPDQLQKAYDDMVKVQERMKEIAKPGVSWGEIYDDCCRLAIEMGYKDNFMGAAGAQVAFIGHGIGIEVDEYPFIARGFDDFELKEHMTFAFEPKAVFPGLGAVGIENTFVVTREGVLSLTTCPEEVAVLEKK